MSDLEERAAGLLQKFGIGGCNNPSEGAREIIAMVKAECVEAVEDKLRFGSTNCCQNLLKTLKEL